MAVLNHLIQPEVHLKPYFHHVPGRLRVRTTAVKGNATAAASVRALLSAANGVTSSEVSTVTGSILVNYDTRLTNAAAICSMLGEHYPSTHATSIAAPEVASAVREHIHRREHDTVRRTIQRRAVEHVSSKVLTFLLQMLLEKAIETAAKRSALLLIAMIL